MPFIGVDLGGTKVAIAACDLAEVIGSAIALNLLFGLPLFWAVPYQDLQARGYTTQQLYGAGPGVGYARRPDTGYDQ